MINRFSGYDPKPTQDAREQLPVGGYVSRIRKAWTENDKNGNLRLSISIEIIEGEYKGFFMKDYEAQKGGKYEAKYKGIYSFEVPTDSSQDVVKTRFNRAIGSIEASNEGFRFNFDETSLVGKVVGFLAQEDEYIGRTFTRIGILYDANKIREGKYRNMEKRKRQENATYSGMTQVDDGDMPF